MKSVFFIVWVSWTGNFQPLSGVCLQFGPCDSVSLIKSLHCIIVRLHLMEDNLHTATNVHTHTEQSQVY